MPTPPPKSTAYTLYPSDKSIRVQGVLSKDGGALFERIRRALLLASGRKRISDADVIDFAVRAATHGQPLVDLTERLVLSAAAARRADSDMTIKRTR